MKSARLSILLAVLALSACERSPQAMGTVNSIIVLAPDSVWQAIGDSMVTALEPRIFTVRDERTFEVTQITPADPRWSELRRFRQVLTIGAAGDAWVQPALEARRAREVSPGVFQAREVWARNQMVTAVVLPDGADAAAALPRVPTIAQMIDSTFRAYATQRMFMSGPDTVLRDSLRRTEGFSILLPNVYASLSRDPHISLFQSSTQVGGDLVRSVLITYMEGMLPLEPNALLAWRDSVAAMEYRPPLISVRDRLQSQEMQLNGAAALEVQGIWDGSDPTWPMSGPFIARAVQCPALNRTYLLDAWLYSPGRAKYEYMLQLQTILNTFECAAA
jgi:hypothetical protein